MVQLLDSDIRTREVLEWKGMHLLHYTTSSCSRKTRIVLDLKQIDWESHLIDLFKKQNNEEWFLGINPRGLVPVLIHDGAVHIESNDILMYLDEQFPDPRLVPEGREAEMAQLLEDEDDLHLDLRRLTMRYVIPRHVVGKSPEVLESYQRFGSGTVRGSADSRKPIEIDFWSQFASNGGITDQAIVAATERFRHELDELDETLKSQAFLFGDGLSLLDIAWFVYISRLKLVDYPVERLHPGVDAWYEKLVAEPAFSKEAFVPDHVQADLEKRRVQEFSEGTALVQVAGLA